MILEIKGVVLHAIDDIGKSEARILVVHDGEDPVACRFFGRDVGQARDVRAGAQVRIEGRLKSREWKGRFYTEFAASRCVLTGTEQKATEPAPPEDDSGIPF